jgi:hypothetical protein
MISLSHYRIGKLALMTLSLVICASAFAQVEILDGRVENVAGKQFELSTPKGRINAVTDSKTRFWFGRQSVEMEKFPVGINFSARIKVSDDSATVKEIADTATAAWLTNIRKTAQLGTVVSTNLKGITVKFADNTTFTYRATEKSQVVLNGKEAKLESIQPGQTLYFHARLLSNYDTWLKLASDAPPAIKPETTRSTSKGTSASQDRSPMASSGEIEGTIVFFYPKAPIFDIAIDGQRYHINYTANTQFMVDGKKAGPNVLDLDLVVRIKYRRDRFGRIMASKISTD